ncbi:hypothetical protein [Photobacterium sanguinicancri]|uniref:hypothetical protein n=1 Tax=Photobacterium sanguinicancri TaxID=875932 RepID=UPI0021C351D4|nr:hypothetical protein [Photobacterium sanguinicancri]
MFLKKFFTEFDDTLTQSLNIDALGMTMIWSRLGQDIFHNRVSSISNDVRNYTLNLLHHYVIKQVVESQVRLSSGLHSVYGHTDTLAFKQACLIYLENLFVFSMLQAEANQQWKVQTQGILGTSKARLLLSAGTLTQPLLFTKEQSGQLLIRQLTLGVSGRYKTPFTEMMFFDKEYRYHHPQSALLWEKTSKFIEMNEGLRDLATTLVAHFHNVVKLDAKVPEISWQEVSEQIKQAYAQQFSTPAIVGEQSKAFWLNVTELDKNAAGSLYGIIDANQSDIDSKQSNLKTVQPFFEQAIKNEQDEAERQKLIHICRVEPLLAECELLFTVLMNQRVQTEEDIYKRYLGLGRNVSSIIHLARELQNEISIKSKFSGVAQKRYEQLLALGTLEEANSLDNMITLVEELLKYHLTIMNQRGQSPWVERDSQGDYRCHIKLRTLPTAETRPYKSWFNRYYLDQFSQLIRGLEGKVND